MLEKPLTVRDLIEPAIMKAGGWVNTHAHADRAFTLSDKVLEIRRTYTLQQKWDVLDQLKKNSTVEDYYRRFCQFFELMISQGVTAVGSFVDIDPQSEDRAITAGLKAREHYKDQLTIKFGNQTLKGVIDPEARKWFDRGAELVDFIGALPKRDERDYGAAKKPLTSFLKPPRSTARWCMPTWTSSIRLTNMKLKCSARKQSSTACRAASSVSMVFRLPPTHRSTVRVFMNS